MDKLIVKSNKYFKGLPKSIGVTKDQVIVIKDVTFSKGRFGENEDMDKIYVNILSRVYIDDTLRLEEETKESELLNIVEQVRLKKEEYNIKLNEYNLATNKERVPLIAIINNLSKEGIELEESLRLKESELDSTSYYELNRKVVIDDMVELKRIVENPRKELKSILELEGDTVNNLA